MNLRSLENIEILKNVMIDGKVAFCKKCSFCEKDILTEYFFKINPDPRYPNYAYMIYLHPGCFLLQHNKTISELDKEIENLKHTLNITLIRKTEVDKLRLFQTFSKDYGLHHMEFIEKAIKNYIELNPTPISFTSEMDFQRYILLNISKIDASFELISKQEQINDGIMDLYGMDDFKNHIIIEVKLIATYHTVSQVLLYIHSLSETKHIPLDKIRGYIVGIDIHPNLIHAVKTFNKLTRNEVHKIQIYKFNSNKRDFDKINDES